MTPQHVDDFQSAEEEMLKGNSSTCLIPAEEPACSHIILQIQTGFCQFNIHSWTLLVRKHYITHRTDRICPRGCPDIQDPPQHILRTVNPLSDQHRRMHTCFQEADLYPRRSFLLPLFPLKSRFTEDYFYF